MRRCPQRSSRALHAPRHGALGDRTALEQQLTTRASECQCIPVLPHAEGRRSSRQRGYRESEVPILVG